MEEFDPDEYLAETDTFDPDEYLSESGGDDEQAAIPEFDPFKSVKALGRGAAQMGTLGFADELTAGAEALWEQAQGNPTAFGELYKRFRDESRANYKKAEEESPTAYTAGQVGGALGTMFVPGGAIAQGGRLLANMGRSALLGGATNVGLSESEDVGDLAEEFGEGATIGGVIEGGLGGIGKLAKKAAPGMKNLANSLYENSTGATGKEAMRYMDDAGIRLRDMGYIDAFDNAKNISGKVDEGMDVAGKKLGDTIRKLEEKGAYANRDEILDEILRRQGKYAGDPAMRDVKGILENKFEDVLAESDTMIPLSKLEETKRNFQKQVNWTNPASKPAQSAMAGIYKDAGERVARSTDPMLADQFIKNKEMYEFLSPIQKATTRRASVLDQSPAGGLLDVATGVASGAGPVGQVTSAIGRRIVGPRVTSALGVGADWLSRTMAENPRKLGKFQKVLRDAQQRGVDSLAATHFILQQTNPEYQEMLKENQGFGDNNQSQESDGYDQDEYEEQEY